MRKTILPLSQCALLVSCLMAGTAYAQSINFSGGTLPTGNLGPEVNTRIVIVGEHSKGTLALSEGAVLNDTTGGIIGSRGAFGTATISSNAIWTSQAMTVGQLATGELHINSGGKLVTRGGTVSTHPGSNGSVTVDGPNSSWEVAKARATQLTIGLADAGVLRVTNGGTVSSRHQFRTAEEGGSTALIEVDGANSSLVSENCVLSSAGVSTIRISNGGLFNCQGAATLRYGNLTLSGSGSKWTVGNDLYVGFDEGPADAVVNINEGAAVEVGRRMLLAFSNASKDRGPGTINIEGSTNPGAILVQDFQFGQSQLGVINFNHTDASGDYVFVPNLLGPGTVNINRAGTTNFAGINTYEGTTSVKAGMLRAVSLGGLSPYSDFVVARGATVDTGVRSQKVKSLSNAGTVTLAAGGTAAVLTVAGNYLGDGGAIALNTALGDSNSATEKLVVHGDTSGDTVLNISNVGGNGSQTTGNGILVVEVAGASNGVFGLPAPGYLEAGGFRYDLVKIGNNWYLSNSERAEASPVEASVACTPSQLGGSAGLVATCTVSLNAAQGVDTPINLNLPATSPRYTTTCGWPIVIAANASQASCTITAVPSTSPDDGDVVAELSIAPPTETDAYAVGAPPAQVQILGNSSSRPGAGAHAVPTIGTVGLVAMASLLGLMGWRRSRKHHPQDGHLPSR